MSGFEKSPRQLSGRYLRINIIAGRDAFSAPWRKERVILRNGMTKNLSHVAGAKRFFAVLRMTAFYCGNFAGGCRGLSITKIKTQNNTAEL